MIVACYFMSRISKSKIENLKSKIENMRIVTVVGFVVSSLLVFTASCSPEKRAIDESGRKSIEDGQGGRQVTAEPSGKVGFVANQFCSACHYGFSDENLALTHEKAGIGCERCHGESERHRSDEKNIMPPEIMYPKAKINPTCMMCHPRHEISRVESHKTLLEGAKTVFDSADDSANQMYCTDCHAKDHRVNFRTIRWNKQTGELIKE
jgi:hypothetical protein